MAVKITCLATFKFYNILNAYIESVDYTVI